MSEHRHAVQHQSITWGVCVCGATISLDRNGHPVGDWHACTRCSTEPAATKSNRASVWLVVRCTQGPGSYLEWVHGFKASEAEARAHAEDLQAGRRHPEVFAAASLLGVRVHYEVRRAEELS